MPGSFDKVIDIAECKIQSPTWDAILAAIRQKAQALTIAPYNHRASKGFLKGLTLRQSRQTGEIMCILTTHLPTKTDNNTSKTIHLQDSNVDNNFEQTENEKVFLA